MTCKGKFGQPQVGRDERSLYVCTPLKALGASLLAGSCTCADPRYLLEQLPEEADMLRIRYAVPAAMSSPLCGPCGKGNAIVRAIVGIVTGKCDVASCIRLERD